MLDAGQRAFREELLKAERCHEHAQFTARLLGETVDRFKLSAMVGLIIVYDWGCLTPN